MAEISLNSQPTDGGKKISKTKVHTILDRECKYFKPEKSEVKFTAGLAHDSTHLQYYLSIFLIVELVSPYESSTLHFPLSQASHYFVLFAINWREHCQGPCWYKNRWEDYFGFFGALAIDNGLNVLAALLCKIYVCSLPCAVY